MHVLFTALPLPSHLRTFIPLAQALIARGHRVTTAVHPRAHRYLTRFGIDVIAAGVDLEEFTGRTAVPNPLPPTLAAIVGPVTEINAADCLSVAQRLRPDLIIREDTEFGGCLVATRLGIPQACIGSCGAANTVDPAWLLARLNGHAETFGLTSALTRDTLYGELFIDFIPPAYSFARHTIPVTHAYRLPLPEHRGEALPEWLVRLPSDRPLIFMATGTLAQRTAPRLIQRAITALSGLPNCCAIVVTGGNVDSVGPTGEHVKVLDYLPQPLLLPTCDLFITHAGLNSVRESLQTGTPMVLTPFHGDQPHNSVRAAELGFGVSLDPATATVEDIGTACQRVLEDAGFAQRVREAQRHLLTLPDTEAAVDDLEALKR